MTLDVRSSTYSTHVKTLDSSVKLICKSGL